MFLTSNQIQELINMVNFYHISFLAKNISSDLLSKEDIVLLKKYNFPLSKYLDPKNLSYLDHAFRFGIISTSLKEAELKNWNYSKLKWYIKTNQFMPLTPLEKNVLDNIKHQSFKDIKGLGNKVSDDLTKILIDVDKEKRFKYEELIREEAIKTIQNRETVRDLVSRIGNRTQDWNRNLGRIADFIMHKAFDEGRVMTLLQEKGEKAEVYKDVYLGACDSCIKAYTTAGIGSQPIIFTIEEILKNGDNIGRKVNEWLPVVGPMHPFCYPEKTEVLTNRGWIYFEDLVGDESFLSVDLESGNAEWVKSIRYIKEKYKGPLIEYKNRDLYLLSTPNHFHPIKLRRYKNLEPYDIFELRENKNIINKEFWFIRTIPNWIGEEKEFIEIEGFKFPTGLFCEFMAWYLSEGDVTKSTLEVDISQDNIINKTKYEEIYNCCVKLFGNITNIFKAKGYIGFGLRKYPKLFNYIAKFGYSYEKYIPNEIKSLSKKYLDIFWNTYLKGDGSVGKGVIWNGDYLKPQESIGTSSPKMAADLGEILLKMNFRPSYQLTIATDKVVFDKKGYPYNSKHDCWIINKCIRTNYTFAYSVKKQVIQYSGYIYDVELEKFNTLFIRQQNKVTLSGNCRCTIHELPLNREWDPMTGGFTKFVEGIKPKIRKTKMRVRIGNEEKFI
jgi:hypothetical protein